MSIENTCNVLENVTSIKLAHFAKIWNSFLICELDQKSNILVKSRHTEEQRCQSNASRTYAMGADCPAWAQAESTSECHSFS